MMTNQKELQPQRVYLDLTHINRHVTGIERIAIELFEKVKFENADVKPVRSSGTVSMIIMQQIWLPLLALCNPSAHFIFPGFPPSPWFVLCRARVVWYIHDLFLLTRRQDLSPKAKLYMAWPFRFAVTRLKYFFVNSEKTSHELRPFIPDDAEVSLYRPTVQNVFDLSQGDRALRSPDPVPLRLVSLGTVEPRKNYQTAVAIRDHLSNLGFPNAELHIIGRAGWGDASDAISRHPNVIVHGYLPAAGVKRVLEDCDIYLCTSFDEGLGLPLLEAQYAGLPVFVPDQNVFHEVLAESGHYISINDAAAAAQQIAKFVTGNDWRERSTRSARENPARWNSLAQSDGERARQIFNGPLTFQPIKPDGRTVRDAKS